MHSLDLTDCDREPIHIPGAVQPHGILLVVEAISEVILQTAGDTQSLLGHAPPLLGRRVGEALGLSLASLVQAAGAELRAEPVYLGSIRPRSGHEELDVVAHQRDGVVILELERAPATRLSAAHLLGELQAIGAALEAAPDLTSTCQAAAREVRRLTGFDRVMVYQFLEDGSGCVLAEDRVAELPPFLNHHYPTSDIPKQARELYLRNLLRVIPDVGYAAAPLKPPDCSATGRPLDMSECTLRSVSPVHVQYLKNMAVGASMSISIVRSGTLWGLVACHHRTPMPVPYELRQACKRVGQILSQHIAAREEAEAHAQAQRLATAREELLVAVARAKRTTEGGLAERAAKLRALVPSDGVAVFHDGRVSGAGHRPSDDEVRDLAAWLLRGGTPDPYATDRLSERYAPAAAYRARASGLLATVIAHQDPLVLLWFRAELAQVIEWAGNPHEPAEPGSAPGMLTPRASFELWRETVHGRSRPWTAAELDAARRFRDAAAELGRQRRVEELNRRLRQTLADKEALIAQKDLLMREVHHRVQNSLQLVNSMLALHERETGDPTMAARFAEARRRILAVSAAHRRLWRSDQIESVRFDTYLGELRNDLIAEWGSGWNEHFRIHAAPMLVPTDVAVSLALVVTELVTNAVRHAYGGEPGPIDVIVAAGASGSIRIIVADQGSGMERTERPDGFGSQLTRLLVAQLKGDIAFQNNGPGTKVILTAPLPAVEGPAATGALPSST